MFYVLIFGAVALLVLVLGVSRVAATRRRLRDYDEYGDDGSDIDFDYGDTPDNSGGSST